MKQQFLFIIRILTITVIMLGIMRAVLLFSNWEYFSDLSVVSILQAFSHGIRFDLSVTLSFFLIPFLLIFLPSRFLNGRLWHQITAWFSFGVLTLTMMILIMDIIFFQHLQRHIGIEVLQIRGDSEYILSMMKIYWFLVLFYLGSIIFFAKLWKAWIIPSFEVHTIRIKQRLIIFPLISLLMILIIRGGLVTGKPLATISAFVNDSSEIANLTLNGVFTSIQALQTNNNASYYPYHQFSSEDIDKTIGVAKDYPFEQQYEGSEETPNIMLLQIESLNYQFIDALNNDLIEPKYHVTPYLDTLIEKSLVYDNFYAAAQYSIAGLQVTWVGLPAMLGFPTIDDGLSTYRVSKVAKMAQQKGYSTFYAQTSKRSSYRIDALATNLGFENYWGLEDIGDLQLDYPSGIKSSFGYDYETLMLLQKKLIAHFDQHPNKPVLTGFFSGTMHSPYIRLPEQFEKYPYEIEGLGGMLNTLSYTDWSIQQFMEGIKDEPWFNNTIFIITADHTKPNYLPKQSGYEKLFHIPLIVYSPNSDLIQPNRTSEIRSQLDLMPTLIDLMGIKQPFSAVGSSLFKPKKYPVVLSMAYLLGSINQKGYFTTDLHKIVESNISSTDEKDALHKEFLMINQRIAESLQENNWAH